MADAHGSGPCVRKDVRVQLPPRPRCSGAPAGAGAPFPFARYFPGGRAPRTPHGALSRGGEYNPFGSAWCSLTAEFRVYQAVVLLIQAATTSARLVVSMPAWGQPGPVASRATSSVPVKYGAPESYVHALVVISGAAPRTPRVVGSTFATATVPCCRREAGLGSVPVRLPQPARVSCCPTFGAVRFTFRGATVVTGESSLSRATSFSLAWTTSVTLRATPDSVASSTRPRVAVVGYGTLPE